MAFLINSYAYAGGFSLPQYSIIGLTTGSAPTGWSDFTSADGRFIRGTTSDGSIGSTGGSTSAGTHSSGNGGSHTGSTDVGIENYRQGGGSTTVQLRDGTSFGNHSHTVYTTYTPPRNNLKLIQNVSSDEAIPQNGIVWSDSASAPDNLSAYSTHNDYGGVMYATTSTGTTGGSAISRSTNSWSSSHDHYVGGAGSRVNTSIATYINASNMSHSHSWSSSGTLNLNRIVLKAWSAAAEVIATSAGIIVLYNQSGTPDGWYLCDGNNGTPNLNNYFVYNNGTAGAVTNGGNTLSCTSNTNNKTHNHSYGGSPSITGTTIAHNASQSHNHSASASPSYTPPYYYLKFIQYAG